MSGTPLLYPATAIVTLSTVIAYFWMGMRVGRTREEVGIRAPAMTGNDKLERTIRAHLNMLEWLPIFLPALWLFALVWNDRAAAAIGAVWAIARIFYFVGYVRAPAGRLPGFFIQAAAAAILVIGAFGRVIWLSLLAG